MKNRIQHIAEQTDIWCDQNYPNSEFYGVHWEERFAKLLLEECMKEVVDEVQYISSWDRAKALELHIWKHFYGV